MIIEYDGTNYSGWQAQENAASIQHAIEEAIYSFCQEKVRLIGAGRTDAGVHAKGQVAHFDCSEQVEVSNIQRALNHYLKNKQINILSVEKVDENFHARFKAKSRTYVYRIYNNELPSVFEINRSLHVWHKLEVEKMQKAASLLIGKKDFSSFRAKHCQAKSPIIEITESIIERNNNIVTYKVTATSFLYHMVRNIVATLLLVGKGIITVDNFVDIIESKDRSKAGPTAKAHGLYFHSCKY